MIGYRFLSPAEEEMVEASLFYDSAASGLGNDFLDDVQQAIDRLREYPQTGQTIAPGISRMLLHRFPFSVVYAVEPTLILVIAIAHHGRRPGYWQSRVDR
jgi:hypothetical protein